jgi:hypothetical protein
MRWKWVVSSALVLVAVGCGSGGDVAVNAGPAPSMTGQWRGYRAELGRVATVDLDLTEAADGTLTGTGHLEFTPGVAFDGTVTGVTLYPEVRLTAESSGWWASFDGAFEGENTVVGLVHSAIYALNLSFALERQ